MIKGKVLVYRFQCHKGIFHDELYVDDAAVAKHRETPHDKGYLSRIPELADRTARVIDVEQARP